IAFTFAAQFVFAQLAFADILKGDTDAGNKSLFIFQRRGNDLRRERHVLTLCRDDAIPAFAGQAGAQHLVLSTGRRGAAQEGNEGGADNGVGLTEQGVSGRVGEDHVAASVETHNAFANGFQQQFVVVLETLHFLQGATRSEERRVGKEGGSRWSW